MGDYHQPTATSPGADWTPRPSRLTRPGVPGRGPVEPRALGGQVGRSPSRRLHAGSGSGRGGGSRGACQNSHRLRDEPVAAPVRRKRHVAPSNSRWYCATCASSSSRDPITWLCAEAHAAICPSRGRVRKYLRLRVRHPLDRPFDPHLLPEWMPVEEERTAIRLRELAAPSGPEAGVELEPALVEALGEHHAHRRPAVLAVAVASATAPGNSTTRPASSYQRRNCASGSGSRSVRRRGCARSLMNSQYLVSTLPVAALSSVGMATTKTIELRTDDPGPRARARLSSARSGSSPSPLSLFLPDRDRARRRRAARRTSTGTPSSTSPAASAASTSATRIRGVVEAAQEQLDALHATPTSRSSPTRSTSGSPSACSSSCRSPAREGGVLQRRHRGGRERGQVRARLHRAPGGDRLRGRLPRPHAALADADLEDAPVQGRSRPVRARGLPRRRSRTTTAARAPRRRWRHSSAR